jgi:hypothetical protein
MNAIISFAALITFALVSTATAAAQEDVRESELDLFMRQVLERRDAGWKTLERYIFTENEDLEIREAGSGGPVSRRAATWRWFERNGALVRSPLAVDGGNLDDSARIAYEDSWLTGGRKAKQRSDIAADGFFNFAYEPGRYLLVGNSERNGRPCLIIEYYPLRHFAERGRDPIATRSDRYDTLFDRTSKITMIVDREDRQIAHIEFSNVSMEYLPLSWLAELDDFHADMTMQRTGSGEWLPAAQTVSARVNAPEQSLEIRLDRRFHDFRRKGVRIEFFTGEPEPES